MLRLTLALLAASFVSVGATDIASNRVKKWIAPDELMVAVVKNFKHTGDAPYTDWDVVTIRNRHHRPIASLSLEEGSGIMLATVTEGIWSPDSRFFVFQTASSGGHSSWHEPAYVYDSKTARIYSIDDTVGPVTNTNSPLHFTHGDVLRIDLWNGKWERESDPSSFPRDLELQSFVKSARVALHSKRGWLSSQ